MRTPARLDFIFILVVAALVSVCGMGYELLIARYLASLSSDSVTSQSLTVGTFLLALGLGAFIYTKLNVRAVWQRLADIEIAIAIISAVSLPVLSLISLYFHSTRSFIVLAQVFPFLIGTLCGIELPALIDAAKLHSNKALGSVLAANYLGALAASVFVPIYLVPTLGISLSLWTLSLLSAGVAGACYIRAFNFKPRLTWVGLAAAMVLPPWLTTHRDDIEQFYLKSFYYGVPASPRLSSLRQAYVNNGFLPRIDRVSTPYQEIDIIDDQSELTGTDRTGGFHLFIDQRNQFGSATEIIYHDTMVHGGINIAGAIPKTVLVIGGGDGLIARELLRYKEITSIRLIELDPAMTDLANAYKPLREINGGSLADPRVSVEHADGFAWLRQHREVFDAIFIDLPHPVSVDLSRLYSVEFYKFVNARLSPDGFVVFDFPFDGLLNAAVGDPSNLIPIKSVLAAVRDAGFRSRAAFGSWETFLIATPAERSLKFDYDKLVDRSAVKSAFNMAMIKLPNVPLSTAPNSIFKPVTIKVRLDRGI